MRFDAAASMSNRLSDQLNDPASRVSFFNDMSGRKIISMTGIGSGAQAVKEDAWRTSLVDRTLESNIELSKEQRTGGRAEATPPG